MAATKLQQIRDTTIKVSMMLRRLMQASIVYKMSAAFTILCFGSIYYVSSFRGWYGLKDLSLIFIELSAGVAITLFFVEHVLEIERQRIQSHSASLDRLCILNSLAELVVFAYIRFVKGETGDIYEAFSNISDPRPLDLYLCRGNLGYDKIFSLITDLEKFSAVDFIIGDDVCLQQSSIAENEKIIADRFRAYFSDTNTIIRNLPAVINRAIQTSSTINDKKLLIEIEDLALVHENAVINKLKTESTAVERYREICNNLTIMVEKCAELEQQNVKRNKISDNMLAIVLQIAVFLICFVLPLYVIASIFMYT